MHKIVIKNFDLALTMASGQVFRCQSLHGCYFLVMGNTVFELKQMGDILYFDGVKSDGKRVRESDITALFRLEENYDEILHFLSTHYHLKNIVKQYRGLRILRQDPYECTVSFLASIMSNIPKHSHCLAKLCEHYGSPLHWNDFLTYAFPESMPGEEELRTLGFGFRAPFISSLSLSQNDLILLRDASYEECMTNLMKQHGIGRKVANCIALFSLDKHEAFPVDVWMKRAMDEIIPSKNEFTAELLGREKFGKYAGYAQQFLFVHQRLKNL